MSIIYEALKKVDKTLKKPAELPVLTKSQGKPKPYLVYILTIAVAVFIANVIFGFFNKSRNPTGNKVSASSTLVALPAVKIEQSPVVSQTANASEVKKVTPEDLSLSGVFFEQGSDYALINNKIVKVGDVVQGLTVKSIGLEGVELDGPQGIIKLNNPQKN